MATTFERAKQRWNQHACTSQAGVCDCPFDFHCESCDDIVKAVGESMPEYIGRGGLCINCFYRDQLMDTTPDIGPNLEHHYRALEEVDREEERDEFDRFYQQPDSLALACSDIEWAAEQGYEGLDSDQIDAVRARRIRGY